ncbi:MAG TPA: hypothetical protein VLH56_16610 [Dissulfurispiraceae bacterium]|nr:hypothetical protein [Dissulfurispiraceae bacterium]
MLKREIVKHVSDLETYAELGKKITCDTDFPFLSEIKRTPETIREAAHQIGTAEGRFYHSLFWSWRNNSADELALDALKEEKWLRLFGQEQAILKWEAAQHQAARSCGSIVQ